jgi:hypothetical protein
MTMIAREGSTLLDRQEQAPQPTRTPLRALPNETPGADIAWRTYAALIVGAIVAGCGLRLGLVLASDFPLNDGGLFYVMARDIQANGYALPAFTSYNHDAIPFGYPPLAMYAAALVNDATGVSLIQLFRFLPLLASCLSIPAFFLLAREMLTSRRAIVLATFIFGMLPAGFMWMIMGGGLTRSFGFLFALLALHQAQQMYARRQAWRVAPVALLSALTLMSHLEMGWYVAFSGGLLMLAYARDWYGLRVSAAVGVETVLLASPWWLTVVSHHGFGPLLEAAHSGSYPTAGPLMLLSFDPTVEPLFALVASLALLGAYSCLLHRRYWLPGWVVAAAMLDVRAFPTSSAVAIALLAAIGIEDVLLPMLDHAAWFRPSIEFRRAAVTPPRWLMGALLGAIIAYASVSGLISSPKLLSGIKPQERDAMAWAGANTTPDSRFLIMTGKKWPVDRAAEWFPALTNRRSIATVQGSEWLPDHVFNRDINQYIDLQGCAVELDDCILDWSARTGKEFDYVYVPQMDARLGKNDTGPCCLSLVASMKADPRFTLVYDGAGALIFRRNG